MERSGLWTPDPTEHNTSIPLSSTHISQASQASKDGCVTLNFAKLNLTDLGAAAVEELLLVGTASVVDAPQRITLGFNRLTRLPSEFVLLSHLRYLNLERNNFTVFPDVLISMPTLDVLDISHNKIRKLPPEAGQLARLRVLCLRRNKLARLPDYLRDFRRLEILQIERNPLQWPPSRVIESLSKPTPQESRSIDVRALQLWMDTNSKDAGMLDLSGYSDPSSNDLSDRDWHSQLSASTDHSFDRWPHSRSFSVESSLSMTSIAERLEDDADHESNKDASQPRFPKFFAGSPHGSPRPLHQGRADYPTDTANNSNLRIDTHTEFDIHRAEAQLPAKQSMPDLRTARLNFTKKSAVSPALLPSPSNEARNSVDDQRLVDHSITGSHIRSGLEAELANQTTRGQLKSRKTDSNSSVDEQNPRVQPFGTTRNPPHPIFHLAETARSLIFALTKVHITLKQHLLSEESTNSTTQKILETLGHDLGQLSQALDVFESVKQRTLPPPAVCRALVESCKDVVATFRHTVDLLNPFLHAPSTQTEIQWAKWLVVEIWAATAEIAGAWQTFLPLLHSITPWLPSRPSLHALPITRHPNGNLQPNVPPSSRTTHLALGPPAPLQTGGGARSRRHAGSFSFKDVELGKLLPSNEEFPAFLRGIAQGAAAEAPTLRTPKRHMTIPLTTIQSPSPTAPDQATSATPYTPWLGDSEGHSRQSSQTSIYSSSHSPLIPSRSFLDFTSTSESDPTQETIQAVLAAVDIAPSVWDLLDSMAQEGVVIDHSIQGLIQTARGATFNLASVVNDAVLDVHAFQHSAQVFLKTVVQLSNMVKSFGRPQDFPPLLRGKMLELTNATEHFAVLLPTMVGGSNGTFSRSISPLNAFNSLDSSKSPNLDDLQLSFSLSRGRSIPTTNTQYLSPNPASSSQHLKPTSNPRHTHTQDRSPDRRHEEPG